MRIGIFSPYLEGLTGGEKYILSLASCLSMVHNVEIFWDDPSILNRAEKKFGIDLQKVKVSRNIFSHTVSFYSRFKASKRYDVCIVLSDGSLPLLGSKKLFVHFQFPTGWINGKSIKNRIKMRRITKIFCNSQFTKKYIDKTFYTNSTVIYPPIQVHSPKGNKENIILNVGRFGKTLEGANFKKHDVMIEAFKKLIKKGIPDWKFILVISVRNEDREKFKDLELLAKGYPIEFIVNPDNKKLIEVYQKAKIYWHASGYGEDLVTHPEYAEHFGMTTVEAMGAGEVPVVINAGGQTEVITNQKNGILWETVEELIDKTKFLISDNALMKKLSLQAEKRAKDFNVEKFCMHVNNLINE